MHALQGWVAFDPHQMMYTRKLHRKLGDAHYEKCIMHNGISKRAKQKKKLVVSSFSFPLDSTMT